MTILKKDFDQAVHLVVQKLPGVTELYPSQTELLRCLVEKNDVFLTSPTNSGKTLPPVILPSVLSELNKMGYSEKLVDSKAVQLITSKLIYYKIGFL